ncbi:TetR family transcriptional regulator [Nocardia sp. NBC_00508]|uniref:TetR/AcrR family transcriptional regulator n=1 Tax=Nocardia sp. NBC_00508 TaxID=2975992 RepID=UPI002E80885F|nr:TetR family transcriptional regulator [Nocardia sp. NBC_00508]WUD63705.1 TetR family transcriptional regulator [Nocardia sp. NBC_00508]
MSTSDRRVLLVDTAIDLIATKGIRALTHRALDTALDLPAGSCSYYFRTRRALLEAIADRIAERSRADFTAARLGTPTPEASGTDGLDSRGAFDPDLVARAIAVWVDRLLADRCNHLLARHALLAELRSDPELRARLAHGLFSVEHARELFRTTASADPQTAAADFVAVLEGAVFDRFTGNRTHLTPGSQASVDQLTNLLVVYLRAR